MVRRQNTDDHIVRLYELSLLNIAQAYDLEDKSERLRSVADLENLFFRIAGFVSPDLFIEAGANDAAVSIRARKKLPDARIVAFEANPHNYKQYFNNEDLKSSEVEYHQVAISNFCGSTNFNLRTAMGGVELSEIQEVASLGSPTEAGVSTEEVAVEAITLDQFFEGEEARNAFLWMDVEGAQKEVIGGGKEFLAKKTDAAFIEVEDRVYWHGQWTSEDVHRAMLDIGFIPCVRDFQSRYQYNVLYLKEDLYKLDYVAQCLTAHRSFAGRGKDRT